MTGTLLDVLVLMIDLAEFAIPGTQNPVLPLGVPGEIQLVSGVDSNGVDWGPSDRNADHAQVATDNQMNALVVFHSTRLDFPPLLLKQVEVVYFRYSGSTQTWTQEGRALVGAVNHSPLGHLYTQQNVKCERPDVVVLNDRFFVVWTRIYDSTISGQQNEPAVLEGSWVRWTGSALEVNNGGLPAGRGFIIDSNYWVRECAGVPDAVSLGTLYGGNKLAVGIVYPHQTKFSDPNSLPPDLVRKFDLRLKTCTLDTATGAMSTTSFPVLGTNIRFNGSTDGSPGLILPEVAPAGTDAHFFFAYEEQIEDQTGLTSGRVVLQLYEITDPLNGDHVMLDSHLFGNVAGQTTRRPVLSTYRPNSPGSHIVSIAFNTYISSGDGDVVYEEWNFTSGATKVPWPPTHGWDNLGPDRKPVPLHGRNHGSNPALNFRRCYAERIISGTSCSLLKYDFASDATSTITSADGLQRPAVSYIYDSVAAEHWVALTWEQTVPNQNYTRVYLMIGH
jgi:hypothetical protein